MSALKYQRLRGMIERRIKKRKKGIAEIRSFSSGLEEHGGYDDGVLMLKAFASTMKGEIIFLKGALQRARK